MRTPTRCTWLSLPTLLGALACTQSATIATSTGTVSSSRADRAAYVVTLGTDTVAVEQYVRTGNRIEGDIVQRQPVTAIAHYVLTLAADGSPQSMEYVNRRPDGTMLPNGAKSLTMLFGRDTVTTQIQRDTMVTTRAAARGAYPLVVNSVAMYQVWLDRLRAARSDSATVMLVQPGGRQASAFPVKFLGGDSARVWLFGPSYDQYVHFDRSGQITSVDGTRTTLKTIARSVPPLDVKAIAMAFATRDAAGQGFGGPASPRDTAKATIGGASIWVDYGRPALRGRDVWQNGVLGDTIWRTGANAATQLSTSADLIVNGVTVPAGKYTLWTHATSSGGYELVFNKQTGQWGTEYHAEQDVVRVPLRAVNIPSPSERFTIAIDSQGSGGTLRLSWGAKELSLPFTVK
jgi:hypothetical protein